MKMLHVAYRVQDLERSLEFYKRVGFREIGRVAFASGSTLLMLNLPGDGDVVTLELVYDPGSDRLEIGTGFSHIVVQVDHLDATLADTRTRSAIVQEHPHGWRCRADSPAEPAVYDIVRFDKICRTFASIARARYARDVRARSGAIA